MSAATIHASGEQQPTPARIGEWFWRFLAVVMLAVVGWVVWIAIQISPPDMVLPAAYEAAAQGRASRNSAGTISAADTASVAAAAGLPADPAQPAASPTTIAVAAVSVAPAAIEPPVNLEKLRRAESIETPIFERPRRAVRIAADAAQ